MKSWMFFLLGLLSLFLTTVVVGALIHCQLHILTEEQWFLRLVCVGGMAVAIVLGGVTTTNFMVSSRVL